MPSLFIKNNCFSRNFYLRRNQVHDTESIQRKIENLLSIQSIAAAGRSIGKIYNKRIFLSEHQSEEQPMYSHGSFANGGLYASQWRSDKAHEFEENTGIHPDVPNYSDLFRSYLDGEPC